MTHLLRLALLQAPQQALDVPGNIARIDAAAARAAAQGADMLVLPEMFLTGYDIGADEALRLAEAADGASAAAIAHLAKRHAVDIVYGFPERVRNAVFNGVQWIAADGRRVAKYRKTHLFGELDRTMFVPGDSDGAIVEWKGWQVSMLICYDIEFPEPARRLAAAGADLLIVPTANMVGFDFVAQTLVPARAYESQLVIAYANCCGHEGRMHYGGLSVVAAADGRVLMQAGREEALLFVTLDRDELLASRATHTHLADRRRDL